MRKRIVWIAAIVVVLAAGTWAGIRFYGKKDTQLTASFATTQVRKGTIEVKVSGTGNIQPIARQTLKANTVGTALKVNFKQGDAVKQGDVLITYEQEDNSNQVRSKEIDLQKKKLELTDLQKKYKEASDDSARDSIALTIQKQQLDIEMAQEDISSLSSSKAIDPIVAPIDGVLATFDVQAGDNINPNGELGEIVNYAQMQMVVGIDELDIPKVQLDQEAQVLVEALPDKTYTGKVLSIADEGTSSNGVASFSVTIVLNEIDSLKAGMSAEASIMTAQKAEALYVPVEAVQSSQGKYYVMVPAAPSNTTDATQGAGGTNPQSTAESTTTGAPPRRGQAGDQAGRPMFEGNAEQFQNMTDEERAAMREQFMASRGGAMANRGINTNSVTTGVTSTTRVEVEVGINNEDNIEILSGLQEGDLVVLPTVVSASANANMQGFQGFGGGITGAIPGGGIMGGNGGGVRQFNGGSGGPVGGGR